MSKSEFLNAIQATLTSASNCNGGCQGCTA
jgi:hypothetical protein